MKKLFILTLLALVAATLTTSLPDDDYQAPKDAKVIDGETRLFTGNQQQDSNIASGLLGLGVGVGGVLLAQAFLDSQKQNDRCRHRLRRDDHGGVQGRFLGIGDNKKPCPPYRPPPPHHHPGYRPPPHGHRPAYDNYRPPRPGYDDYHPPRRPAYDDYKPPRRPAYDDYKPPRRPDYNDRPSYRPDYHDAPSYHDSRPGYHEEYRAPRPGYKEPGYRNDDYKPTYTARPEHHRPTHSEYDDPPYYPDRPNRKPVVHHTPVFHGRSLGPQETGGDNQPQSETETLLDPEQDQKDSSRVRFGN